MRTFHEFLEAIRQDIGDPNTDDFRILFHDYQYENPQKKEDLRLYFLESLRNAIVKLGGSIGHVRVDLSKKYGNIITRDYEGQYNLSSFGLQPIEQELSSNKKRIAKLDDNQFTARMSGIIKQITLGTKSIQNSLKNIKTRFKDIDTSIMENHLANLIKILHSIRVKEFRNAAGVDNKHTMILKSINVIVKNYLDNMDYRHHDINDIIEDSKNFKQLIRHLQRYNADDDITEAIYGYVKKIIDNVFNNTLPIARVSSEFQQIIDWVTEQGEFLYNSLLATTLVPQLNRYLSENPSSPIT